VTGRHVHMLLASRQFNQLSIRVLSNFQNFDRDAISKSNLTKVAFLSFNLVKSANLGHSSVLTNLHVKAIALNRLQESINKGSLFNLSRATEAGTRTCRLLCASILQGQELQGMLLVLIDIRYKLNIYFITNMVFFVQALRLVVVDG